MNSKLISALSSALLLLTVGCSTGSGTSEDSGTVADLGTMVGDLVVDGD